MLFSKYREYGYALMPVLPNTKQAFLKEFQKFSENLPPEELTEQWDRQFSKYGFGLICGKASDIIALDVDTEKEDVVAAVPMSPVRKAGKPGRETRFFKYNKEIPSIKIYCGTDEQIEFITDRRYTVMPPSIHPDTKKPYVWLTPDTLPSFHASDLPELTMEDVRRIEKACSKYTTNSASDTDLCCGPQTNNDPTRQSPHNSQARLRKLASGLINGGLADGEITERLLDYDTKTHLPIGYFTEYGRTSDQKSRDPNINAFTFVRNIRKSINDERKKNGEAEIVGNEIPIKLVNFIEEKKKVQLKPFPTHTGLIKDFVDYCGLIGQGQQESVSLGAAIAMVAAMASNRFRTKFGAFDVWPNTYAISITYSGWGKEIPQKMAEEFLSEYNLIGAASYRSGTSMVMDLPEQQERLDLIDECSAILRAMGGKEDYKSEIVEILSSLYSKAQSKFLGISSAVNGKNYGACWNPCVNVLGSTTPSGFKGSVRADMASRGMLPRFLLFYADTLGDYARERDFAQIEFLSNLIKVKVQRIASGEKTIHPAFVVPRASNLIAKETGIRYLPKLIPFTPFAEAKMHDYAEKCHKQKQIDPDGFESAFVGRFAELSCKVALLAAVSDEANEITDKHVDYAIELVETQFLNAKSLYELVSAENHNEADFIKIEQYLKKNSPVEMSKFTRKFQAVQKNRRLEILQFLTETGLVEQQKPGEQQGNAKPKTYLTWIG